MELIRFQKFRYSQIVTRLHRSYSRLAFTKMQMIQGSKRKCVSKQWETPRGKLLVVLIHTPTRFVSRLNHQEPFNKPWLQNESRQIVSVVVSVPLRSFCSSFPSNHLCHFKTVNKQTDIVPTNNDDWNLKNRNHQDIFDTRFIEWLQTYFNISNSNLWRKKSDQLFLLWLQVVIFWEGVPGILLSWWKCSIFWFGWELPES